MEMTYKGLKLDDFQIEAIEAIHHNHSVVVSAPTGSGKTLIADYIVNRDIHNGKRIIYTAPIKALSNQKYKDFCAEYGEENIGMLTGDVVKNPHAPVLIMTTEIYRNMVLSNDEDIEHVSYVIFDEIHYINDIERGTVWEESIIFSNPNIRMLCLSATIPNAHEFARWIETIKGHKVHVISHPTRYVPLHLECYDTELGRTSLKEVKEVVDIPSYTYVRGQSKKRRAEIAPPSHAALIKEIKDKTPCLFFCFSRMNCQKNARELMRKQLFQHDPVISAIIRKKLDTAPQEINTLASTQLLRQCLPYGIGFHHAGLLPVMKELVEELFGKGLIKVLYTTETFAVGINMPAKTACFENVRKYDGRTFRFLNSKEFFQIAGRAGRRGIDDEGFVYIMINRRDFDYEKIKQFTSADTDPIISQFKLSVNTVLNLIDRHSTKEIEHILSQSFFAFQAYGEKATTESRTNPVFNNLKKKLEHLGYLQNGKLTEKGTFASKMYADEIVLSEIFGTELYKQLNEYQVLLVLACVCYEGRERTKFFKKFITKDIAALRKILLKHEVLARETRFKSLAELTALTDPCYHKASLFDIIPLTNMQEGDLVRFFRQIVDRINQIKMATTDRHIIHVMEGCQQVIANCLKDID